MDRPGIVTIVGRAGREAKPDSSRRSARALWNGLGTKEEARVGSMGVPALETDVGGEEWIGQGS